MAMFFCFESYLILSQTAKQGIGRSMASENARGGRAPDPAIARLLTGIRFAADVE